MSVRTYPVPEHLLNAVVQLLNTMPAIQSRGVLNALEVLVQQHNAAGDAAMAAQHQGAPGLGALVGALGAEQRQRGPERGNGKDKSPQIRPQGGGGPGEERP